MATVGLACMVRNENNYLMEYVRHYIKLGISKIVLIDNNEVDGERIEDVLADEIGHGIVVLDDRRGMPFKQGEYLQRAYDRLASEVDWVGLFDVDELVCLKYKNTDLRTYLAKHEFRAFDIVRLNWVTYGDCGLVRVVDNDYSMANRFTRPIRKCNPAYRYNRRTKAFLRSSARFSKVNAHGTYEPAKCCDANGAAVKNGVDLPYYIVDPAAWVKHYRTKTIQEFVERRIVDSKYGHRDNYANNLDYFFQVNDDTPEKRRVAAEIIDAASKMNKA